MVTVNNPKFVATGQTVVALAYSSNSIILVDKNFKIEFTLNLTSLNQSTYQNSTSSHNTSNALLDWKTRYSGSKELNAKIKSIN
jgi:hypothetical protein